MCRPIGGCTPQHLLSNAHGHLTGCHSCQSTPRHTAVSRRPRLQIQMDSFSCPRRTLKAQRLLDAVLQAPEIIETDATRALHSLQHLQQTGAFSTDTDTVHCFMFAQARRAWLRDFPRFPHLPTKSQKPILICLVLQCAMTYRWLHSLGTFFPTLMATSQAATAASPLQDTRRSGRRPRLQIQMDSFSCPRSHFESATSCRRRLCRRQKLLRQTRRVHCTACSICNKQVHSQQIQCVASCPRKAARVAAWFSSISTFANKIVKTHSNLSYGAKQDAREAY